MWCYPEQEDQHQINVASHAYPNNYRYHHHNVYSASSTSVLTAALCVALLVDYRVAHQKFSVALPFFVFETELYDSRRLIRLYCIKRYTLRVIMLGRPQSKHPPVETWCVTPLVASWVNGINGFIFACPLGSTPSPVKARLLR